MCFYSVYIYTVMYGFMRNARLVLDELNGTHILHISKYSVMCSFYTQENLG